MAIILAIDEGRGKPLSEVEFTEEGKLQDYLEQYPPLISIEDIDENAAPLLCIGREVGVPSGSIDLLFIGRDGVLTMVETKLAKNPEARRTVVGQIIEYASYIYSWTADNVYEVADAYVSEQDLDEFMRNNDLLDSWWEEDRESYDKLHKECDTHRVDMIVALKAQDPELYTKVHERASELEFSPEDFRNSIELNLRNGKIRLLIAVDKLVEPLKTAVTFLNENSNFDIFLLQVRDFEESDTKKVLVPTLFGGGTKRVRGKIPQYCRVGEIDKYGFTLLRREKADDMVLTLWGSPKGRVYHIQDEAAGYKTIKKCDSKEEAYKAFEELIERSKPGDDSQAL